MTADDLMRLIGRYTEACDDLGAGLFEQTAADTDAKHGKATFLHGRILTEVHRLHADLAQARQTAEYWKAEHLAGNARIGELHDEADARKCCTCDGMGDGVAYRDLRTHGAWEVFCVGVSAERERCAEIGRAAQAVLDRWNSPKWEWRKQGPTADLMEALFKALKAQRQW